ncbi:MAG: hypothetical protein ACI9DK_001816 [Vicingaceae bacterium]
MDIPKIENAICECASRTRDALFTLKLNAEDLEYYFSRNKFTG